MHFTGAGASDHANDFSTGGSADNGIVNQNDPFAIEQVTDGIEFEFNSEVANLLGWLDEGSPDVVITNQGLAIRNTRLGCVSNGSSYTGVGYRNHDIGVNRVLA